MTSRPTDRRLPVGAEIFAGAGVHFRVWAPRRRSVEAVLERSVGDRSILGRQSLELEKDGYFSGWVPNVKEGTLYRYCLDGGERYPDPASRFQPAGPHGPSQVIDASRFLWTDRTWQGVDRSGQVIYEMHIGTFTQLGTWKAAQQELAELADAGITLLEIMPVADFPGAFGWGYDGVNLFAPTRLYGEPDDFRRFVDRAHGLGLGVILDVVYNHLGPDGNYLKQFSEHYFTGRYTTDWGEAINFDGAECTPVREFFVANAGYWLDEFHLDGLRLDATQKIYDSSTEHVLTAISRQVRQTARGRSTLLVAENEEQHVKLVRPPEQGGYGIDALWNDDFHHSAQVALTGHNEAYYSDFLGRPQEFISAVKWGYLYQGQRYAWQKKRRGTPAFGLPPTAFVGFIQNHDQIANSGRGLRCHSLTSPGKHRAITALLLLAPHTPMLFQGQEFSASSPFFFFADHSPGLAPAVRKGRLEYLKQFPSLTDPAMLPYLPDPGDPHAFARCKLDLRERQSHSEAYALHRDLLKLRRDDLIFRAQRAGGVDGAVLGSAAFVLRFFADSKQGASPSFEEDRLLIVNLGRDLELVPAPEPLLAPPERRRWDILWSSEDPHYGGNGTAPLQSEEGWRIPGEAAVVLAPKPEQGSAHG